MHEEEVHEVCAHYADLVQEYLAEGQTQREAEQSATRRIGRPLRIARQILDTPTRLARGRNLQKLALGCILIAVFIRLGSQYLSLIGTNIDSRTVILFILFCSGLIFGVGLFLARGFHWKPTLLALLTLAISFIVAGLCFEPLYRNLVPLNSTTRVPETSWSMILMWSLGYVYRISVLVGQCAAAMYAVCTLALLRGSIRLRVA